MTVLSQSLRLRLLVLILLPLTIVSVGAVSWRFSEAKKTAEDLFDRNLLMMSFAVSRDVALSEGDSLSAATTALFKEVSGGDVFYHIYGPDGSFVTGYSSPPIRPGQLAAKDGKPQLYDAAHRGSPVRVARLSEQSVIDGISGRSVITVWQQLDQRDAFARRVAFRAGAIALLLLATVASLVFFGIRLGLKPLLDLEDAIQKRSSDDLSPIARRVPQETKGIVTRLNSLFGQVTAAQESKDRFISNAAHQLRNPIAAIHSMAQATQGAKDIKQARQRADALVVETRRIGRLTDQLLSLERLKGQSPEFQSLNFGSVVQEEASRIASRVLSRGLEYSVDIEDVSTVVQGNETLLKEAVANLLDNALLHGGDQMTLIEVSLIRDEDVLRLSIENDGNSFVDEQGKDLFNRFTQGAESEGSGLGLAIVKEIALLHSGRVGIVHGQTAKIAFEIPNSKLD